MRCTRRTRGACTTHVRTSHSAASWPLPRERTRGNEGGRALARRRHAQYPTGAVRFPGERTPGRGPPADECWMWTSSPRPRGRARAMVLLCEQVRVIERHVDAQRATSSCKRSQAYTQDGPTARQVLSGQATLRR